ncbi:MAG: alkaline phosphatase [Candidatus Hydrogenedentota bacterium]|nr:MAG: alkaline phosphatase [Candidatus Hydrogenedentota bacterium]
MIRLGSKSKGWKWAALAIFSFSASVFGEINHVILIGCDGMSPDGIRNADTPVMDKLMKEGAYTLHARGVFPTSSGPNWASMINGAGPEQHGVLNNDWEPGKSKVTPSAEGPVKGMFPTIYAVLREQKPQSILTCVHDWDPIPNMFEANLADKIVSTSGSKNTTKRAVKLIKKMKPTFLFIHMDDIDHVGHGTGHGTPEYYASVAETDVLIGNILQAVKDAGIENETVIIITSDHGGHGTGHGQSIMADLEIPWIVWGSGIVPGKELKGLVNTYDTAATIAHLLGVKSHPAWIGKPVLEALKK